MKHLIALFTSLTFVFNLSAQNTANFDYSDNWIGYMNVFYFSANYLFSSVWGLTDVKTTLDSAMGTITLQPNFWT